jgi:hypothetical protein
MKASNNHTGINTVSISGRITNLRYYEDGCKWVFILAAPSGRYYVECTHPEAEAAIALGNQVIITGSLFSRRTRGGNDSGSICAEEVLLLARQG